MHRVGMIGLGKMGLPIARNLMERGFEVTGYRRQGSPELAAAGGTVAGSAAEVAASADVLLSIVPDAAAVHEVICGRAGTLTTLRPGTVHIEMSTIDVGGQEPAPGRGPGQAAGTCWTARSAAARRWSRRGWPPRSPPATRPASTGSGLCWTPSRGPGSTPARSAPARG